MVFSRRRDALVNKICLLMISSFALIMWNVLSDVRRAPLASIRCVSLIQALIQHLFRQHFEPLIKMDFTCEKYKRLRFRLLCFVGRASFFLLLLPLALRQCLSVRPLLSARFVRRTRIRQREASRVYQLRPLEKHNACGKMRIYLI